MKISIVTISFNQARYLEQTIKSIIEQQYEELEYIIVDPGSTDGSREIINKYKNFFKKIIFEPDNGPADGLNKGFSFASGEIFAYLNSDDYFLPGTLKKINEYFQQSINIDVIYGNGYITDDSNRIFRRFYSDSFTPWRFVHNGCVVMQQSTFFTNNAFRSIGGFNENNHIWWDAELLLDFSMNNKKIKKVDDFLSVFRIHEESISGQKWKNDINSKRIDEIRKQTHARLFKKVTGESFNERKNIYFYVAYIQKIILQPRTAFWKLIEKIGFTKKNVKTFR